MRQAVLNMHATFKAKLGMCLCIAVLGIFGCIAFPAAAFAAGGTLSGEGTQESPYLVEDAQDLVAVSTNVNGTEAAWRSAYYKQTADIDMSSVENFTPIGLKSATRFTGEYDGNGKKIESLTVNASSTVAGLFGYVGYTSKSVANGNYATIKDITLSGNITTTNNTYSDYYAGGIVARANYCVRILNCLNQASVTNTYKSYTGGIVGYMLGDNDVTVDSCGNEGAITGTGSSYSKAAVGGIAGVYYYGSVITNCYNKGTIAATGVGFGAGGIVGQWTNTSQTGISQIESCYNVGNVTVGDSVAAANADKYGAIVGFIDRASYSYGAAPENNKLSNCYYLDTACNQAFPPDSDGFTNVTVDAKAKTDAEMKASSLVGLLNGAEGTAWIRGADYPMLSWQMVPGAPIIDADLPTSLIEYNQNAADVAALAPTFSLPQAGMIGANGTLTYQWYKTATGNVEDGVALEGETKATFTPSVATVGEYYYYCVATNTWTGDGADLSPKTATTSVAHMYVHSATAAATPVVNKQPVSVEKAAQDAKVVLSAEASVAGDGAGVLSYQWYVSDDNRKANASAVEGAVEATFSPDTTALGTKYYYCTVTNTFELTKKSSVDTEIVSVEVVAAEIATPADLKALADRVNAGDSCAGRTFLLTADIDLSSDESTAIWDPIGFGYSEDYLFSGVFDGQGHAITGLNAVSSKEGVGLFGSAGYGAEIKNFTVSGKVSGAKHVGGVIGATYGDITISHIGADVEVSASGLYSGAFMGTVQGSATLAKVSDCYARGSVANTSTAYRVGVGGFVGGVEKGAAFSNCYTTASVASAGAYVGGFYGYISSYGTEPYSFVDCYAAAALSASSASNTGAFGSCGNNTSLTITNCYYDADINEGIESIPSYSGTAAAGVSSLDMKAPGFPATLSSEGSYVVDAARVNSGYPVLSWEYINGTPAISQQPEGATIVRNSTYEISVVASAPAEAASGVLSYQWYKNTSGDADVAVSEPIEGATQSTYSVPTTASSAGITYYFCVVTNTFGENKTAIAVSSPAKILVLSAVEAAVPQIVSLTGDATYEPGEKASPIRIQATLPSVGAGVLSYQWYQADERANDISAATLIEGATGPEYTPEVTKTGVRYYFCEVTNTFENVKSASSVSLPVAITGSAIRVASPEDLVSVSNAVQGGNSYEGIVIELARDIDLSGVSFAPIGTSATPFAGTFDGKNYTISNLDLTSGGNYNALFGSARNASIRDFKVSGTVGSTASQRYVAGIVGYAENCAISNVKFAGSVTGGQYVGGIVGYAKTATVSNVVNSAPVVAQYTSSTGYAGGIIGCAYDEKVSVSYALNTGSVTATASSYAGGIIGDSKAVLVSNCKNMGDVVAGRQPTSKTTAVVAGGIMGRWTAPSGGVVSDCYNTGDIASSAGAGTGGIVGEWDNSSTRPATMESCYNTGTVFINSSYAEQSTWHGGLVGYFDRMSSSQTAHLAAVTIENCFSLGQTTIDDVAFGHDSLVPDDAVSVSASVVANAAVVTADQLKGAQDITCGETTGNVFALLNGADAAASYVADDTGAPFNHGFPVLSWEARGMDATYELSVSVSPADADVAIVAQDGHAYSAYTESEEGARIYTVPAGDYTWSASAFGYLSDSGAVSVGEQGAAVQISLLEAPRFDVTINPSTIDGVEFDGEVTLSSVVTGDVALENGKATVSVGEYSYTVSMDGYLPQSGTIEVLDDDVVLNVVLEHETVWNGTMAQPSDMKYNEQAGYYKINVYMPSELAWVANKVNTENDAYGNAHITLMNDVALNAAGETSHVWAPIGKLSSPFYGVFDGNGHRVSGVYTEESTSASGMYAAFIGMVGKDGATDTIEVKNLVVDGMINAYFFGGGLVGNAASGVYDLAITNCGNEADVVVSSASSAGAGGILGYVMASVGGESTATINISGCYNKGAIKVSGKASAALPSFVGGIVGQDHIVNNESAVVALSDCYNTGDLSVSDAASAICSAGGIIGNGNGAYSIAGAFNTGAITAPEGSNIGAIAGEFVSQYGQVTNTALWLEGTAEQGVGKVGVADDGSALTGIDSSSRVAAKTEIVASKLSGAYKDPAAGASFNEGVALLKWESEPVSIDGAKVTVPDVLSAGGVVVPTITVELGGTVLTQDVDYAVSYKDAAGTAIDALDLVAPGIYTVVVEGKGAYVGSAETTFEITLAYTIADLSEFVASASADAASVKVSADGSDVYVDVQWVSQENLDALTKAIEEAQKVIGNSSASLSDIQAAGEGIVSAQAAFDAAKQMGTKQYAAGSRWTRLGGENRYDTDAKVIQTGFEQSDIAIVASGEKAADALAASGLAGILKAPVVLTASDSLSSEAAAELGRLQVKQVYLMGGSAAVSDDVMSQIASMGIECVRVAGDTRTATACEIYAKGAELGTWGTTAVVANGVRTPDALSVAAYAYAKQAPIFLASSDGSLDEQTAQTIAEGGFDCVIIVGGTGVVTEETEQTLGAYAPSVKRLGGATRYETSALVAQFALSEGMTLSHVGIATGRDSGFADALGAAALCGSQNSVLVLAQDDGTGTDLAGNYAIANVVDKNSSSITGGYLFGGTSAFSASFFEWLYALD